MTPLNTDPARARANVTASGGWITWTCPHCKQPVVPTPARSLHWVLTRIRYHMRLRHGYVAIPGWQPDSARRVSAAQVAARYRPGVGRPPIDLSQIIAA